jgi:alpha-ketoglutarate-dependent 2,4-dichlorophenoxyacetate dioxygenase
MPGVILQDAPFETITAKELHSSFGAEVIGADFQTMSEKQLNEIKAAMAKVRNISTPH